MPAKVYEIKQPTGTLLITLTDDEAADKGETISYECVQDSLQQLEEELEANNDRDFLITVLHKLFNGDMSVQDMFNRVFAEHVRQMDK